MTTASPASATAAALSDVVSAVRGAVRQGGDWARTARLVAGQVCRLHLPGADILTEAQRQGDRAGYRSHLLPPPSPTGRSPCWAWCGFPGQVTPVHDHVTWCAFGVLQGTEHEDLFSLADDGGRLVPAGSAENTTGQVSGFAPPGDISRVRNANTPA